MTPRFLFISALSVAALYAAQPSFDCTKVKKNSCEALICQSEELTMLDNTLAALYIEARNKTEETSQLKASQRSWIKNRNECFKYENRVDYMKDLYQTRIEQLKIKYKLDGTQSSYAFDKNFTRDGITFTVQATGGSSLNKVTISPSGFSDINRPETMETDGEVVDAQVADLNGDGAPEIYVFVSSAGSGSYGSLVAYSSNKNQSMSTIYLPELNPKSKEAQGYMGHDSFSIDGNRLVRRFPIYKKRDPNCCPTGGTRELRYKLVPGEAVWQLKLVKNQDLPPSSHKEQ